MKVVVIASGRGRRIYRLTAGMPKALLRLFGLSLLERTIMTAKEAGFFDFIVVVGYLGKLVKKYIESREKDLGVRIQVIENKEWRKGNLMSLFCIKDKINENFILLTTDHIFDAEILKELKGKKLGASVMVAVDRQTNPKDATKVLEKDNKILDIGKDIEDYNCVDAGIFLCSPKLFFYAERAKDYELSSCIKSASENNDAIIFDISSINICPLIKKQGVYFLDIDTPSDYKLAQKVLLKRVSKKGGDVLSRYVIGYIGNFILKLIGNIGINLIHIKIFQNLIGYFASLLFLKDLYPIALSLCFLVSILEDIEDKLGRLRFVKDKKKPLEAGFNFLFEHSWFIALAINLYSWHSNVVFFCMLLLLFDGFCEYIKKTFLAAKGIELQEYSKITKIFKIFEAQRNNYIIILFFTILLKKVYLGLCFCSLLSIISAFMWCFFAFKYLK